MKMMKRVLALLLVFAMLMPNKFLEDKSFGAMLAAEEIADTASPELADIRRHKRVQSAKVKDSLQKIISSPAGIQCQDYLIDEQMKADFISALQPALAMLSEQELRPAQLPAKVNELRAAMNEALRYEWIESRGITVTGIRDYGDEGVVEYVVSELVRLLHGFGEEPWEGMPREITGLKVGIVGLGKSGGMIADAMRFFGAEVSYFARSEKAWATEKGYRFLPLKELLKQSSVVFCCLNKNTVLLHEEEFEALGYGKVLFNTGLSPAWDEPALLKWFAGCGCRLYCDTVGALGGEHLLDHPFVRCVNVSTGRTKQAFVRLSEKVLHNIKVFLGRA